MDRRLTLAGCFAHPDDETWSMGGSFALLVPEGVRGVIWTATRGQAGEIADGSGATRETLAQVREAEERAAMALVGVGVELGDFLDGQVADADQDELTRTVHGFLERERPDVVVTFEPDGVTAHPDHRAVTAAVQAAFAAYAAGPREREPRLYYWGVSKSQLRRYRELGRAAGVEIPGEGEPYGPVGTADERFTCIVDTSPVAELVYRVLRQHRSQSGGPEHRILDHAQQWREVFARTEFIRVHPAPRPGEPPETSLLAAFAPVAQREPAGG
ncbi:MAG TPA: PIG-L family deacetylase [Actinomycetes bacterium]|nr:PIG-L family deacetylase [Actinomycetes bacterium]